MKRCLIHMLWVVLVVIWSCWSDATNANATCSNDSTTIANSLSWLVDTLDLEKQGYASFTIKKFVVSPDECYVAVTIASNSEGSGPLYRYMIYNPDKHQIYYPPMEQLNKKGLGYPFNYAAFSSQSDACAIIVGYRSLSAMLVALPEGKVIKEIPDVQAFDEAQMDSVANELFRSMKK